jgi:LysR family glycine cleavage system transcriptional activator
VAGKNGLEGLKPVRSARFSHYEQVVHAALGGQGLAIGQTAMLSQYYRDRLLVRALPDCSVDWGALHLIISPKAAERPPVKAFLAWLKEQARAASRED